MTSTTTTAATDTLCSRSKSPSTVILLNALVVNDGCTAQYLKRVVATESEAHSFIIELEHLLQRMFPNQTSDSASVSILGSTFGFGISSGPPSLKPIM